MALNPETKSNLITASACVALTLGIVVGISAIAIATDTCVKVWGKAEQPPQLSTNALITVFQRGDNLWQYRTKEGALSGPFAKPEDAIQAAYNWFLERPKPDPEHTLGILAVGRSKPATTPPSVYPVATTTIPTKAAEGH